MSLGDEVQAYYKRLVDKTDELERAINAAAGSFLARSLGLDVEIRTAGAVIIGMLRKQIIPSVKKIADTLSMPDVLRDKKANWQTIDSSAKNIAGKLGDEVNGIRAQIYWTGAAATAYGESVTRQKAAVTGLTTASSAIQTSLETVAAALDTAGLTIIPGITGLILSLTAAAISAATVVGLPAALALSLSVAASFLASCAGITAGFINVSNAQSNQANSLQRALDAQGDWPVPNTASYNAEQKGRWKLP